MIQKIINDGKYKFIGNINAFKKCISSFKITKVISQGECQGIEMLEVFGKFRYHGRNHKIHVSKSWTEDTLFIEYIGSDGNEG